MPRKSTCLDRMSVNRGGFSGLGSLNNYIYLNVSRRLRLLYKCSLRKDCLKKRSSKLELHFSGPLKHPLSKKNIDESPTSSTNSGNSTRLYCNLKPTDRHPLKIDSINSFHLHNQNRKSIWLYWSERDMKEARSKTMKRLFLDRTFRVNNVLLW